MAGVKISSEELANHFDEIQRMGPRYCGMEGEALEKQYLMNTLEDYGLEKVHAEPFDFLSYVPEQAEVEVLAPEKKKLNCKALQFSANASVEGDLVYVGTGSEEEFAVLDRNGVDFAGKIVMASAAFTFFTYPLAEKRGAAGVLIISDAPEEYIREGAAVEDGREGKIPGVIISLNSGFWILTLMSSVPTRVAISSQGKYSQLTSYNVIADAPGETRPEEQIVVCSHYDSQLGGGYGWDNVGGNAAALELSRALKQIKTDRTIRFIFTSAEEQGILRGSWAYVQEHTSELPRIACVFTFDGTSGRFCPLNIVQNTSDSLFTMGKEVAAEKGWRVDYGGEPMRLSDHIPFMENSVPAMWILQGPYSPYYHTEKDVPEHVSMDELALITEIIGECALKTSSAKWPLR